MERVRVEDAVGMVVAHDLTKIVPDSFKGAAFKKGHIIRAEDIEELKRIGKNHIWAVTMNDARIHENEAAGRLARVVTGDGTTVLEALEGKSNIHASRQGLLQINLEALYAINELGNMALVTLHNNTMVQAKQLIASAKIIPLTLERRVIEAGERISLDMHPVIQVKPLTALKTGIIVTGTEVYEGRIHDRFGEVLKSKVASYGGEVLDLRLAPDDADFIYCLIRKMIENGAEAILISGGMAVDADDVTPQAIGRAAKDVVAYGIPLLPGAMGMVAYCGDIPIIGVPACAMFNKTTVLDIILPRIYAMERIKRSDLVALAHGGLCSRCGECRFPFCSFGK
ncbi:MAG TPA: molybdopterin-binding protein [Bacillota bacterium]|nr:molybdopterin-binding protein [Bacillota bacterium]